MGTPYTTLYDGVLAKIKDYTFANMPQSDIYDILSEYVRHAIVAFRICKVDLSDRNEDGFNNQLNDTEIEILTNYMTIEYLKANYVNTPLKLKQMLSSKDFTAFSPANHLEKVTELIERYRKDNETLLSRYAWVKRNY